MKKWILLLLLPLQAASQANETRVVIITIDGVRWQEVFAGADSSILFMGKYLSKDSTATVKKYWNPDPLKRRNSLFPFLWSTVEKKGAIYGNRWVGNKMNTRNPYWFSYPGYSEIFTGYADTLVNSNDYKPNPNENVLGFLNKQPVFKNRVVAFTNWNAYKRILNEEVSGFMVNDGMEKIPEKYIGNNKVLRDLNELQFHLPALWHEDRLDAVTYRIAKQYMITNHPKVVYISFGETDEWAHSGKYDFYLDAAKNTDEMIADLWNYLETDPFYKGRTSLLITTDHGRGLGEKWTSHNNKTLSSDEIWMAVIGSKITPRGELKNRVQYFQAQIAQTIAFLAGYTFSTDHPVEERIGLK